MTTLPFFPFLFLIELGLGSPRGPVELGYPMARGQRRRDLLCFLFTGSDSPARTSAPAEVRAGRAGLDPVRRNNSFVHILLHTGHGSVLS